MKAALLGAVVTLGIDNRLGLLGLSSGTKFVLTGGVERLLQERPVDRLPAH